VLYSPTCVLLLLLWNKKIHYRIHNSPSLVPYSYKKILVHRNPVGARFSPPLQTDPTSHPASYTMGTGFFPGVKRPGGGVHHPPPARAEVKERVELYLYSPSGPSCLVLGWTYTLPLPYLYLLSSIKIYFNIIISTLFRSWHSVGMCGYWSVRIRYGFRCYFYEMWKGQGVSVCVCVCVCVEWTRICTSYNLL